MAPQLNNIFQGAEVSEGVLLSGDATVLAFCRHENKNNFVLLDVDERRLFCDTSVTSWLPSAVSGHLGRLSKSLTEKAPTMASFSEVDAAVSSTVKKSRSGKKR
jgi:hypothetical protein